MDDQTSSRKKEAWTFALVIVSVVALGIVFAGLLTPPPEPELTTAPPTSTAEPEPVVPEEFDMVEEPVDLTADIPGCDVVEQPDLAGYSAYSVMTGSEQTYDNPRFPWFNGPKATAMSQAVAEMLPGSAEIEFASPERSLIFQPITDFGDSDSVPDGYTSASGSVVNGNAKGSLYIGVQPKSDPIPPCVAGHLDERRTLTDGTVVDIHDTWREVDGVRTLSRSAQAYVADGSWISASASDSFGDSRQENSGEIPLAVDDLVRIVADPRLRVSTAVPPGTPSPTEECHGYSATNGPAVSREQARHLDAVLATIDLGGPKLNPLQLGGNHTLCTGISDAQAGVELSIAITGGQALPTPERPEPGSGGQKTLRTLEDGTVVQTERSFHSVSPMNKPEESRMETSHSVVVTRPGGTQISVSSSAATPDQVLPFDELESIALTPGLEL